VAVTGYKVYRGGVQIATTTGATYSNTGLAASTSYTYAVAAYDAANNVSNQSASVSTTTLTDGTAPSVPASLTSTAASASQVNLSWASSTDNVAVAGYKIFRNNSQIATTTQISYQDTGLTASIQYSYQVSAFDAAGNTSAKSATSTATTQAAPVSQPSSGSSSGGGGATTPTTCSSWTYTVWSSCTNGQQTRTITISQPSGCSGGTPVLTQSCSATATSTNQGNIGSSGTTATSTVIGSGNNQNATANSTPARLIDEDKDGLSNDLEVALRSSSAKTDTDGDSFSDYNEVLNGFDPTIKNGKMPIDQAFAKKQAGKICLQVESKGQAWYINPTESKRYYLGRPDDAFSVMRRLGLGVKHEVITKTKLYPARLVGKILIDTENKGKAYYINPKDRNAYYLGRPADAFNIMRRLGVGMTDKDLDKIRVAL
jgi:chitodextrinase